MYGGLTTAEWCRSVYGRLKAGATPNKQDVAKATEYLEQGNYDSFHERIASIINKETEPKILVDMGCGSGYLQEHLAKNIEYIGLDFAPTEKAKDQPWFRRGDKTDGFPITTSTVDIVVFSRSLDCDGRRYESLIAANRVLKMGGVLIIREQVSRKKHLLSGLYDLSEHGFQKYNALREYGDNYTNASVWKHIDHNNNTFFTGIFCHQKTTQELAEAWYPYCYGKSDG